jgi:alpha,alpha-trehalase
VTLAGIAPLFFQIATQDQANKVAEVISAKFLSAGGVVNTLRITGQQWDAPNGWAPLQWMTITGLENYGQKELAAAIARRWIKLNSDVFRRTGKLMEKYDVVDTHLEAGGGEYEGQDGFGWTNGVLLALIRKYGNQE